VHPFVSGHPVVLGLVITSVVIWGALEVRQSTKRRPEAAKAAWGNPIYLRLVAAVGVAAAMPNSFKPGCASRIERRLPQQSLAPEDEQLAGLVLRPVAE
jgi:protein-S-isoprenylcysteine O-methyltransferase Ste14